MSEVIKYSKQDRIATVTLNRPEKYNTLRREVIDGIKNSLEDANRDDEVRVIVLEGAGDSFCGGFDFSGGLEHYEDIQESGYDPGMDVHWVTNHYTSYITTFMGLWRGLKPTISKVHGYCVGGGSELAMFGSGPRFGLHALRHPLLPSLGLPPHRYVGIPPGLGQSQILCAYRRLDQRKRSCQSRTDQLFLPARRTGSTSAGVGGKARADPPYTTHGDETRRQSGL